MKKTPMIILLILTFLAALFIIFLAWSTVTDFKPAEVTIMQEGQGKLQHVRDTVRILSWNIGYGGLDAGMDFFYDGGHKVRPGKEVFRENINAIMNFLVVRREDFVLLQEVDRKARRSYYTDEEALLQNLLPMMHADFALNYDVAFVPSPLLNPMGRVEAGLMSFSRYTPVESVRYSLPGNYAWPLRIFMLDRCLLLQRIRLAEGPDLVVINTHNSAYDEDGRLRKAELAYLRELLLQEYAKGNYIVCGGDWNQNPPGFSALKMQWKDLARDVPPAIPADYLPEGWTWCRPGNAPTNRDVSTAYEQGLTPTSVIDYFVVSPNINLLDINTSDLGFRHSDHNPVSLEIQLKRPD